MPPAPIGKKCKPLPAFMKDANNFVNCFALICLLTAFNRKMKMDSSLSSNQDML